MENIRTPTDYIAELSNRIKMTQERMYSIGNTSTKKEISECLTDITVLALELGSTSEYLRQIFNTPELSSSKKYLIEEWLKSTDCSRVNQPVLLIALIRNTFSIRHSLNNWELLRDNASKKLQLDFSEKEVQRMLRGLYS